MPKGVNNRNHYIEIEGECLTITQWSEKTGVPVELIRDRLNRNWEHVKAVYKLPRNYTKPRYFFRGKKARRSDL